MAAARLAGLLLAALFSLQAAAEDEYPNVAGPALRLRPAYDGSSSSVADVVPILDYSRKGFFARTVQGVLEAGARAEVGGGLKLGGQLAYEEGRKASESAFLRENNVPDIGVGLSYGVHAEWEGKLGPAPALFLARWRQQANSDRGAQLDLRGTVGVFESGPWQAGVFAQATWADRKSMRTYYGAPGYDPSAGLLYLTGGLLGSYDLSRRWSAIASVEARRLEGDAARSPLAERRWNSYFVAGVGYRF